ncbi:uncharacterized protein LOC135845841 [Planococcus citri]|uniref:uncharacterized protein LOC135845841 n=1 Tax=Planococcus citri TaxID=170843 RepID=UPI0031F9A99C
MDPNQTPEKGKSEQRIPSPGSTSSVHSIRPLEWDSGADIGYQNPSHPHLSTVERIALQNGSSNLFKTGPESSTYNKSQSIGNPLAESSPFIKVPSGSSSQTKDIDVRKPLVDYTISDDQSFEDQSILVTRSDPIKSLSEISKSLEDLRHIRRSHTLNGRATKSSSSQNLSSSGDKHHKKFASSSSVATVIPQELHRQVSNKSIQVDENSLAELFRMLADAKHDNCSTYTINSSKHSSSDRSKSRLTESNSESVDGGSFEYVRGSQYNSKQASESNYCDSTSSGGIHTLCNEVIDGVDLVTQYVNNLNVSNKNKVLKKVAKSLLSQIEPRSQQASDDNSLKEVILPTASNAVVPLHRVDTPSQLLINSNTVFQPIQKPDRTDDGDKSSTTSKFESTSIEGAKTSDSVDHPNLRKASRRQITQGNKSRILESSDFSKSTSSCKSMPTYTNDTNSYAASGTENSSKDDPNVYSLKKYLAKEREAQLLWIRSGIDHLNNLKKLYESQKILRKDLVFHKRATSSKINLSESESLHPKLKQPHSESRNVKRTPKSKSIQTSTSDLNNESPLIPIQTSRVLTNRFESSNKNTVSTKKLIVKRYCKKYRDKKSPCNHCPCLSGEKHVSENKENIEQNVPKTVKKPISYTVLFDKTPCLEDNKCHKEPAKEKAFDKVIHFSSRTRTVTPEIELKPNDVTDPCPSLQEYLLKNKPEYVDRAEFRRQCLYEIAQLRELRDKSKNELMSLITNSDESDINTVRRHLPPAPLTVMRIFNDRALREQTEKKYKQLPEVLAKKLEQRKRENNRRNQIMAKVFTKKLQRKVLKGQVNLANSASVISN